MPKTSIEWVINPDGSQGHTVNPIRFRNLETGKIGHHCEKISAGCANCYASAMQKPYLSGLDYRAENRQRGEFFFDESVLDQVRRRRAPTTYFWCDMTDLFGEWVPGEWIDRCWAVMLDTPQHRHIVLTKRARRLQDHLTSDALAGRAHYHNPPDWIILGVSCEDQAAADERIPYLLRTPAVCRMGSFEPLLGPIKGLWKWVARGRPCGGGPIVNMSRPWEEPHEIPGLDWVIVGGESGPGARPMRAEWARVLRDQCALAGVPFFFKQWGAWLPACQDGRECGSGGAVLNCSDGPIRVGKKAAGRLLDGRVWDERPEVLR